MFDEAWVEVAGGELVRLPELSARLAVGEKGPVSACSELLLDTADVLHAGHHTSATNVHRARDLRFLTRKSTAK